MVKRKDESVTGAQDKIAKPEMKTETQRKRDFTIYQGQNNQSIKIS